jgi:hypothetical protein
MTKCWRQIPARRTRRHHGKGKKLNASAGNDYKTKPKRGHTWVVDRDKRGNPIPGTRRCKHCKMLAPGKGKPGRGKMWENPKESA